MKRLITLSITLLFLSAIPSPILMILFGFLWKKNPPKKTNWIYVGYRSRRAMKNENTWNFAHMYQAKVWLWTGSILLIMSLILPLIVTENYKEIPSLIYKPYTIYLILTIIPTEIALKNKFDEEGNLIK